jgi:hypothetical protein
MSTSYSITETITFTLVHARFLASKVATDLLRFQRFYGRPTDQQINDYESEITTFLREDCVDQLTYGFKRNGKWVEAVRYRAIGSTLIADDDPGKLRAGAEVSDAYFTSFLSYKDVWWKLSEGERQRIRNVLPFQRSTGEEPGIENGYWFDDRNYSAGGRRLSRSTIKGI